MMAEFNLSEKGFNMGIRDELYYLDKYVKEFIKRLKEELFQMMDKEGCIHRNRIDIKIDELAGNKLK